MGLLSAGVAVAALAHSPVRAHAQERLQRDAKGEPHHLAENVDDVPIYNGTRPPVFDELLGRGSKDVREPRDALAVKAMAR